MKVLQIINNLGSGGAEKLIEDLVPLLNKELDVDVLLLTDKNNVFEKKLINENINIDIIPLKKIYSPLNIYYIRNYIIKGEYDIVHVHLFPSQYWTSLAVKTIIKNKPKLITTEHSTNNRRRDKKHFKYIDKFIYKNYDKIISISEKAQDNLIDWLELNKKDLCKFQVVNNGVDLHKFSNAKPYKKSEISSSFDENIKLICMVGRFTEAKDQNTVIRAIEQLPKNIHLLLVGVGPLKNNSKKLSKDLDIKKRVHFLGFREDIDRILKTSDIVVLSSYWEGLSLSSIEGMASGKPFLASDAPGLREVVEGAGIIYPIEDYKSLSRITRELLDDKELYIKTVERCLERSKEYSINMTSEKYIEVYNS